MGLSPEARVYLTTIISLAGVALATFFGMEAGRAAADRAWWTLGAVAASVTAAGVPAYEQIRKERMRARAQEAAVDAAVAMRVTMNDALDPIVRQLGRVAAATRARERAALAAAVIPMALDSAAHLVGSGRVRACLFRVAPGIPDMLIPDQYSGRVDDPLESIAEGTAQGDLVFSMIRHNQHLFCPDVDASLPPGWQVTATQTYQSFAAVPVAAGQNAFGMLMVDALEKDGIRRADVPLIRQTKWRLTSSSTTTTIVPSGWCATRIATSPMPAEGLCKRSCAKHAGSSRRCATEGSRRRRQQRQRRCRV